MMVNGDLDLWQEGVCQFVGLPKKCPSLRYYQGPFHTNHFTCNTSLQRRAQIFCSTQQLGKGITKLTMVSFDLQTVLPCFDSWSSSTQRLSGNKLVKAWCWRTPQSQPLHTCGKSRLRALNDGGSSAAGARARLRFSSFCFRWSNLSLLELFKVISLDKMLF